MLKNSTEFEVLLACYGCPLFISFKFQSYYHACILLQKPQNTFTLHKPSSIIHISVFGTVMSCLIHCYCDWPYHTVKNLVVKNAKFGELCTAVWQLLPIFMISIALLIISQLHVPINTRKAYWFVHWLMHI